MADATKFTLVLEFPPWTGQKPRQVALDINDAFFRDALDPLPSDREINPHSGPAVEAARKKRNLLAGMVADSLKQAAIQLLQEGDTENGYSRNG